MDIPKGRLGKTGREVTILNAPGRLDLFCRYAHSQPVTNAVIDCDTREQLEKNVRIASSFALTEMKKKMLSGQFSPIIRKLMYYKR
jgi:hypothetical protein